MKPIAIEWSSVSSTTTSIASAQTVTSGVALALNYNYSQSNPLIGVQGNVPGNLVPSVGDSPRYSVIPNLGTGAQTQGFKMPVGTSRSISIVAAAGSLGTTQFQVDGFDENGNALTYTGTPASFDGIIFHVVTTIIPQATLSSGNTVIVGLGNDGYTTLVGMDVWNKNNNYTIAYAVSGTVSLTPYYTVNSLYESVNGQVIRIPMIDQSPGMYYVLPVMNTNFIDSPSTSNVIPVTTSSSYSVVGIPLTGLMTSVSNTTGSFTQTILQQGGLV